VERLRTVTPEAPEYPARLRALPTPPASITIEGGPLDARRAVAIVGTREPTDDAAAFAFELAGAVARCGGVVVSGGAVGIDTAAHRGALEAAGRTWVVAPTGRGKVFPAENAPLFDAVAATDGAMVWPFADGSQPIPGAFQKRNAVLAALADVLVVVQAGTPSGALNAAASARRLGRPLWVVPGPPWQPKFTGCLHLLAAGAGGGARMLASVESFLRAADLDQAQLGLPLPMPRSAPRFDDPALAALYEACSTDARHLDEIALRARVCTSAAATGLLTLALENVLLEGPDGFFRRAI
jgi:DNA processing protein